MAKGGETGYANNKLQWFLEEVIIPRLMEDDIHELAQEMSEEFQNRGQSSYDVDWDTVRQRLRVFLANQSERIVNELEGSLQMLED